MDEDSFHDLVIDHDLPELLLEDDDEVELCIVRPILETVVSNVVELSRFKDLQKLVEINMEEVAFEEKEKQKLEMMHEILLGCISRAVPALEHTNRKIPV